MNKKVSIIGAGNVGATCANALAHLNFLNQIILVDIKPGVAEGKALDMMQSTRLAGLRTHIVGVTNRYEATVGSDVIIITSGIPRKPGMSREDLIGTNANIVMDVVSKVTAYSPNAVIVMIANPMDTLTYLTVKRSKLDKHKIIGMGGLLDSSRFNFYLSKALHTYPAELNGMVIGGHGDTTMVPLPRLALYKGRSVLSYLDNVTLSQIVHDTMTGGAILTKLIGTSAWYAPGMAGAYLTKAIIEDERCMEPCCVYLDGEYNQKDICIGVPVILTKDGWEEIVELDLDDAEKSLFNQSCESVRRVNNVLRDMNLIS